MALSTTLYIDAPVAKVWQLIDDAANLPLWMPEVIDTVYPDGNTRAGNIQGTHFVQRMKDGNGIKSYQGTVVAYDPANHHLVLTLSETMVTISVGYRLTPEGPGTCLAFTGDLTMNNPLFSMMALAAWPMASTRLKKQIAELKRVAETVPLAEPRVAKAQAKAAAKRASPRDKKPTAKTVRRKPA